MLRSLLNPKRLQNGADEIPWPIWELLGTSHMTRMQMGITPGKDMHQSIRAYQQYSQIKKKVYSPLKKSASSSFQQYTDITEFEVAVAENLKALKESIRMMELADIQDLMTKY